MMFHTVADEVMIQAKDGLYRGSKQVDVVHVEPKDKERMLESVIRNRRT